MIAVNVSPQRLLVNQATTLTLTTYTDGTATDQGTITIGIVDANGDTVVASGTAVTDNSDGTYTYSLAAQSEPNVLKITWTEAGGDVFTTVVEVAGSRLFNEAQIRGFDDSALSSASDYVDSDILTAHDRVADYMEAETGRSWIRRYCRVELAGTGDNPIYLPDGHPRTSTGEFLHRPGRNRDIIRILGATDGGASVSTGSLKVFPDGHVVRADASWTKRTETDPYNIVIEYEYGVPVPVDGADRIAMQIARHWMVSSRIPDHAESFSDPIGSFGFSETGKLPLQAFMWIKSHQIPAVFG